MPEVRSKPENFRWNVLTSKGNDRVNQERFRKGLWRLILSCSVASPLVLQRAGLVVPCAVSGTRMYRHKNANSKHAF